MNTITPSLAHLLIPGSLPHHEVLHLHTYGAPGTQSMVLSKCALGLKSSYPWVLWGVRQKS